MTVNASSREVLKCDMFTPQDEADLDYPPFPLNSRSDSSLIWMAQQTSPLPTEFEAGFQLQLNDFRVFLMRRTTTHSNPTAQLIFEFETGYDMYADPQIR